MPRRNQWDTHSFPLKPRGEFLRSAELCTGARCYTQTAKPEARAVSFRVGLQEGRTKLQATFRDDAGRELCGAYYAYAIQDRV